MTDLKERIDAVEKKVSPKERTQVPLPSFKKVAWQASTDMLAALGVGFGGGLFLEQYYDCSPWGMIIGFVLGAFAGLLNVYRRLCKMGLGFGFNK